MYFEVYRQGGPLSSLLVGTAGDWRWRLKAANHEIIASGEGYENKADCLHAIDLMKSTNAQTPVKDA